MTLSRAFRFSRKRRKASVQQRIRQGIQDAEERVRGAGALLARTLSAATSSTAWTQKHDRHSAVRGAGAGDPPSPDASSTVLVLAEAEKQRKRIRRRVGGEGDVVEVENGSRALVRAHSLEPLLIVAEARTDGIGGVELCRILRDEHALRGTAVLLLTGRDHAPSRTDALQAGADAALAMPVAPGLLEAQVEALCEQRRQYRRRVTEQHRDVENSERPSFLKRMRQVVQQHLRESEFGPQDLVDDIAMSYMQCYRRLRDRVDQTPSQFIRAVRLDRAATLLRSGAESIRAVASAVGFNSTSYFSRCFREHMGQTPSGYRKEGGAKRERATD